MKERQARRGALLLASRSCFSSTPSISFSPPLFLSRSFFLTPLPFSARDRKIVERSIYGYKITHVKFETGRVYLKDLCASLGEKQAGRSEVAETNGNSSRKFVASLDACRTAATIVSLFTRNSAGASGNDR